jgi:hypothetical protein
MGDMNAGLLAGVHHGVAIQATATPQAQFVRRQDYQSSQAQGVSVEQIAQWDEKQVAQWVATLGKLAPFAPLFEQHQIEGPLFMRLDDGMLREMGINLIGPRARLLEELSRLKAQQRRVRRETSIWESDQYDGRSCMEQFLACNSCSPMQLNHYKLTSAYLVVRRTRQASNFRQSFSSACCLPGFSSVTLTAR